MKKYRNIILFSIAILGFACQNTIGNPIPNEFWFDDDATSHGDGSLSAPFSGTPANFDTKMRAILESNANCVVHLLPGTYQTVGCQGVQTTTPASEWLLRAGQRLLGSGSEVTRIVRSSTSNKHYVIASRAGESGITVEDLTIDANLPENPGSTLTLNGIRLGGEKCEIRRVKVVGTIGGSLEGFSLTICPYDPSGASLTVNPNAVGIIIDSCEVSETGGGWLNGIVANGGNAVVKNCRVILPEENKWGVCYNSGFGVKMHFSANFSIGGWTAFYADSGEYQDIVIDGNTFRQSFAGVYFHFPSTNAAADNIKVINNTIELSTDTSETFERWGIAFSAGNGITMNGIQIIGNTIKGSVSSSIAVTQAFHFYNAKNVTCERNRIDGGFGYFAALGTGSHFYDNTTLTGDPYTILSVPPAPPNAAPFVRSTVTNSSQDGQSYIVRVGEKYIGLKRTTGVTIRLPDAALVPGKEFIFVNELNVYPSGSYGIYTANGSGQTINGTSGGSSFYPSPFTAKRFISDGSNYIQY